MFATMEQVTTISAQQKWTGADQNVRGKMLDAISYSRSYANLSWSKLPGIIKMNLTRKTWTA